MHASLGLPFEEPRGGGGSYRAEAPPRPPLQRRRPGQRRHRSSPLRVPPQLDRPSVAMIGGRTPFSRRNLTTALARIDV